MTALQRHARKSLRDGDISSPYLFESADYEDRVIEKAAVYLSKLEAQPAPHLESEIVNRIFDEVPGILSSLKTV